MSKTTSPTVPHFELSKRRILNVPSLISNRYTSLHSNADMFHYVIFWNEIILQKEIIRNWDLPTTNYLKWLYTESLCEPEANPLPLFFWQRYPTLVSFFMSQAIDIPISFQKAKSLYSKTMTKPNLRFITMLMRHGRKPYINKTYAYAMINLARAFQSQTQALDVNEHWRAYYLLFNQFRFIGLPKTEASTSTTSSTKPNSPFNYSSKFRKFELYDSRNQRYSTTVSEIIPLVRVEETLYNDLLTYLPVFSFSIRRVDKLKRRHSRGKSGKYSVIWKYTPKYKRFITVLWWLVRDIRFQKTRTFSARFSRSLYTLFFDKSTHLVYKLRNFVHNYVFQHHKKNLLKTLKSVST